MKEKSNPQEFRLRVVFSATPTTDPKVRGHLLHRCIVYRDCLYEIIRIGRGEPREVGWRNAYGEGETAIEHDSYVDGYRPILNRHLVEESGRLEQIKANASISRGSERIDDFAELESLMLRLGQNPGDRYAYDLDAQQIADAKEKLELLVRRYFDLHEQRPYYQIVTPIGSDLSSQIKQYRFFPRRDQDWDDYRDMGYAVPTPGQVFYVRKAVDHLAALGWAVQEQHAPLDFDYEG